MYTYIYIYIYIFIYSVVSSLSCNNYFYTKICLKHYYFVITFKMNVIE